MTRRVTRTLFWLTALTMLGACVTVNIYFPAAEVRQAADTLVEDIYTPDGGEQEQQPATNGESMLRTFLAAFGPSTAHAQSAATVSNAAIRGIKAQLEQNHARLAPHYASGVIGIAKNGDVVIRDKGGLSMKSFADLKRLVRADNELRHTLYAEVAKALETSETHKVQDVFARTWQSKAPGGWWIQDPSGAWRKK